MSIPFKLVRASVADGPRLVNLLASSFDPDEPLQHAIGAAVGGWDSPEDDEDEYDYALKYVSQGHSLLAIEGDTLIGAAINHEVTSDEYNLRVGLLADTEEKGLKLFYKFWAYVEHEAGYWEKDGPQKALDLHILVVNAAARGRGVGKALIEGSRDVARENGYKLFRIDCTSYYSARLAESVGMTCVYSLPYQDFKNENGESIFKTPEPHSMFKIFKQKL